MRLQSFRRQFLLFVALGVPCVCVVVLGTILVRNSRELARARVDEDRQRRVSQAGGELMAALERVKLDEAGALAKAGAEGIRLTAPPRHRDVALIGWIEAGHLVLPWQADPDAQRFRTMLDSGGFAEAVASGERREAVSQQYAAAVKFYERARAIAATPLEHDYATLLLARATVKLACACTADARRLFASLLHSPSNDDQSVPVALYAAKQLLDARVDQPRVLAMLDRQGSRIWSSPSSLYLQRALLGAIEHDTSDPALKTRAAALTSQVNSRLADAGRAIGLQRDLPTLLPAAGVRDARADPVWRPYADGSWLVSDSPPIAGLPAFVIAVRAAPLFAAVSGADPVAAALSGTVRFSTSGSRGQPLGPVFPGIRVEFVESASALSPGNGRVQGAYYILSLASVVALTAFVGFISWRDIRRQLALADLRSQFVASVSHELRTPLTAIRMFAETLQLERPLSTAAKAEYLSTIVSESERLTRLINNVLDYSKIERGQKVYRLHPASVAAVVRAAAGAMHYPLAQQGFDLRVDLCADLPPVPLDEDAIQQAVLNLLTNAMKYSRDRREIDLRVGAAQGRAVIEVRDYGAGIPPHEQSRIFDRFYRVPGPDNARIPGAGLGLALVDHIVKAHGGSITVRSAPGDGSTFAIHLPLEQPA